jgi:diaminopropionate ammonia-lyase
MTLHQSWFARDARGWTCEPPDGDAAAFHRRLPGYAATPLVEAPGLAAELGVGRLFVKDESARFDLRAFKFLGASWAGFRAVAARTGYTGPTALDGLRAHLREPETAGQADLALVTATDGNHGRAVARTARLLGLPARVYLPKVAPEIVIDRISAEGAHITVVDADYDGAVMAARSDADGAVGGVLIQDTAWAGYEEVPSWIVDGYETMFAEIDAQLSAAGVPAVDLVSVQVGVGSLAQAAVAHYRSSALAASARPRLLCVEPDTAACVLRSLADGALVSVPTDSTVMNGLNCGTPSSIAWPYLRGGLDAAIAVTDDEAREAIASLTSAGVSAGPSGAAGLAGLRAVLTGPNAAARRRDLGLGPDLRLGPDLGPDNGNGGDKPPVAVCICTEGPLTDGH